MKTNYIRKYKKLYYNDKKLIVLCIFILHILSAIVLAINAFVSRIFTNQNQFIYLACTAITMFIYSVLTISLNLLGEKYLMFQPLSKIMQKSFEKCTNDSSVIFGNSQAGSGIFSIMSLPQTIISFYFARISLFSNMLIFVTVSTILFLFSPFALFLVAISIGLDLFLFISRKKFESYRQEIDENGLESQIITQDVFDAIVSVKLNAADEVCAYLIDEKNRKELNVSVKMSNLEKVVNTITQLKSLIMQMFGVLFLYSFSDYILISDIANIMFISSIISSTSNNIIHGIIDIKTLSLSVSRHIDFLNTKNKAEYSLEKKQIHDNTILDLQNIQYKTAEKTIFDNACLKIAKGEKVAITGQNGSGKSTLLKIIAHTCPELVTAVWSKPHLFNLSLKTNLVFNKDFDINREKVEKLCTEFELNTFFNSLPNGFDTKIDMNQMTISDGENMRLALVRSLVYNSEVPIILLDEFSRSVDSAIETKIIKHLLSYKDLTVIAVTNRTATAQLFDKIYCIDQNQIKVC